MTGITESYQSSIVWMLRHSPRPAIANIEEYIFENFEKRVSAQEVLLWLPVAERLGSFPPDPDAESVDLHDTEEEMQQSDEDEVTEDEMQQTDEDEVMEDNSAADDVECDHDWVPLLAKARERSPQVNAPLPCLPSTPSSAGPQTPTAPRKTRLRKPRPGTFAKILESEDDNVYQTSPLTSRLKGARQTK